MSKYRTKIGSFFAFLSIVSILAPGFNVRSQDLIASEDIAGGGGSSVFVFRQSAKKSQMKSAASGRITSFAGKGGSTRKPINVAYVSARRKNRTTPITRPGTTVARRRPSPNAKLKLSETQTAAADKQMDAGQTDQAIATYREALKNNPKNAAASNGLSDALTAKGIDASGPGNSEAGVVYLDEAVKLDPKNDVAYAKLGEIFVARDQAERGIANYEKALVANSAMTELYVPLGLAYLKTGNIVKAEEYAKKSDSVGASSADAAYLRAMVLYKQNKNPEALAAFQETLKVDPTYSAARYYEAATYDRLNQSDQSIAEYKRTVESDPQYAPAWFDLGVAYYNVADYNNAANAYQQSIKYDPNNAEAHANLASTYRQQERFAEANAEYKQAESLGIKNDPNLYNEWGYCLGKTNEWDKSAARLMTANELGKSAVDNSNVGWAYYNAGAQATTNKDDAAAKANYELGKAFLQKAVEQDPKLDAAYLNLGSTYNGLGEYQLAVSILNVAVGLRPNWVLAINQLGRGYRGAGNVALAIAQFELATNLDKNNVLGLFSLGEAYNANGDKKNAKKVQDRLKKIDPNIASRLDAVFNGKAVVDETKRKIENKIKIPKIPY